MSVSAGSRKYNAKVRRDREIKIKHSAKNIVTTFAWVVCFLQTNPDESIEGSGFTGI